MRKARLAWFAAVVVVALGGRGPARADTGGGNSVVCGSAPGAWNVPNGASVNSRSQSGVVANVLNQLGEYYSHTMISHGATWMSHASMQTPRANVWNSSTDNWNLADILQGGPGAATVNMGGAYTFLYRQPEGPPMTVDYVDGGALGVAAANALLALPDCATITDGKCHTQIADPQGTRYIIGFRIAGATYRHSYGVYTFVNAYNIPSGVQTTTPYAALQCATFVAMALNWGTGTTMTSHAYANAVVAPAVQKLYDIIHDFVQAGGGNAGTQALLANQMTNCFTSPTKCDDRTATPWQAFKATGTASSISPDRIRGINGHADVVSPWKGATQAVQWNAAGTVYGCWSETFRTWTEPDAWAGGTSTCTPSCLGGLCGQSDGCGGICPSTEATSCGVCGNAACGGGSCPVVNEVNIGSATDLRYTITGTNVTVNLSGGTGDGDLYVKLGSAPTTSSYGCKSTGSTNTEACTLTGTGTFHILVHPYSTIGGTSLRATVGSCAGACTPVCGVEACGQSDGCGGVCPSTHATTCGMCGNAACTGGGTCAVVDQGNLGGAAGAQTTYTITGTDVHATLAGGTGDADLYVRLGAAPTTTTYNCRSNGSSNSETCNVSGTGTWYVMVRGYTTYSGTKLDASVTSCAGGGACVPTCTGDLCGQANGCGGYCLATDAGDCGQCGNPACGGGSCGSIAYTATLTNSASYTDVDTRRYNVNLAAGTTYTFSTCAAGDVDTYLRLHKNGTQLLANDDGCPTGYASKFTYTPTAAETTVLSMGCYYNNACAATVAISPAATSCSPL